ncbi:hypothetical protein CQW23_12775 [Capsicum baccatum]|uniref:NB-ARC domain-containing protein n=1 Tax=Capsicum baccatum TaxID=33114 RepID=A0A2G2WTJ5_CAPBA|nr:hypothetical protein CQW23_12775 [Capsicum baccatum]
MSCISYEVHGLVQSLFHQSGDDMLVKLKDHVVPYLLKNIKSFIASDYQSESSATMTEGQLVELLDALLVNLHYLPKVHAKLILPSMTQYELLQNVFGNLKDFHGLKVNGCIEPRKIHVMIEFLLIILTDVPKDIIHHGKLFVLLECVGALTKEASVLVFHLEENIKETRCASLNLLENIELLRKDLKNVFLTAPADSSQLNFSVKEYLEHIRSFFSNVVQKLHRDLWTRVLDVAYEAKYASKSILARDHGIFQLIFLLPDTIEKIKIVKKEVQEKISKKTSITFANSPNKPVINKSSIAGKIIVGFEEEIEWIIRNPTSRPKIDVISIVGMPEIGKTTLAYRVYNDMFVVGYFDVCAWYIVD